MPDYSRKEPAVPFWTKGRKLAALIVGAIATIDTGLVMSVWPNVSLHDVGIAVVIHAAVVGLVGIVSIHAWWKYL